jgi:hypothetical protein
MEALLTTIVLWLSANFGLPSTFEHPTIKFLPAIQMNIGRLDVAPTAPPIIGSNSAFAKPGDIRVLVAFYDSDRRIIYLSDQWTGRTAADTSVVVHEMVHHLQRVGGLHYECPSAREKLALEAQDKWLRRFGHSLESDFHIDRLTMLVTTSCCVWRVQSALKMPIIAGNRR